MQIARQISRRINDWYWSVREFPYKLRRSWGLVRVHWNTIDGDWSSIAIVLLYQIRRVRRHIAKHNIIADADRVVRQMQITELLLERMLDEPYADLADKRFPQRNKHWANHIAELEKQDINMLTRELRYLRHWWD